MTLTGLKLTAGLAALATMGLVACGDNETSVAENSVLTPPGTTLDPAATPTPPPSAPSAPPEIVAPGTGAAPQQPLDPTDPTAPPPPNPPPVLPDSSPN